MDIETSTAAIAAATACRPEDAPAILENLHEDRYHGGPGISKTGLWTLYTKTPAHYAFGEREEKKEFALGQACHDAILRPDVFSATYVRGPDDRRGNKWKDLNLVCEAQGRVLLTSGDYDAAVKISGRLADHPIIKKVRKSRTLHEPSAYWIDPETGVLCRCRPDIYAVDVGIILDLKTTTDARPKPFARAVADYGYHVQEAFYTEGWQAAGGGPVEGFVFAVLEKTPPYAVAVYELHPDVHEEGRAIARKALRAYADCLAKQEAIPPGKETAMTAACWPAYPNTVQELAFDRWHYRETQQEI